MRRARNEAVAVAPEVAALEVECTTCGLTMTSQLGSGGQVRYFHCARCQRWSSSFYDEVFSGQAGMRRRVPRAEVAEAPPGDVQARIASWLASLSPA